MFYSSGFYSSNIDQETVLNWFGLKIKIVNGVFLPLLKMITVLLSGVEMNQPMFL
jgi:hypothetical protein